MRRVLIGRARRRLALRRGAGVQHEDIDALELAAPTQDDKQILAVDEALNKLATANPQRAELVKLRYFVGLSIEQSADTLGISPATAKRWWSYARAWMHTEMRAHD
jgi:RNA polymerase sigma factor (TIGR02999 family)